MAATPPPIISDLPQSPSRSSEAPHIHKAREDSASTTLAAAAQMAGLSPPATSPASRQPSIAGSNAIGRSPPATTPGASSFGGATRLSPEDASTQRFVRSVSVSTSASNGLVDNVTERSGSVPHSHYSQPQYGVSPQPSVASVPGHNHGVAIPYQRRHENQNGPQESSMPPKANQNQEPSSYTALWELMQKTDPSVVRQVVRENWQKCLTGSDYHSTFVVSYLAGTFPWL